MRRKPCTIESMVGKTYAQLTVLGDAGRNANGARTVYTRCVCGAEKPIRSANLINGNSKSCGCLQRATAARLIKEQRTTHGMFGTTEYGIWSGMVQRCSNPKVRSYKNYGGRGIEVCQVWREDFAQFLLDMGKRPSKQHSIDRVDNNLGYTPDNCRWATWTQQANNRRKRV